MEEVLGHAPRPLEDKPLAAVVLGADSFPASQDRLAEANGTAKEDGDEDESGELCEIVLTPFESER